MHKLTLTCFCFGIIFSHLLYANEEFCPRLLKNESDLDKVYELSELVFIGHISPRSGPNEQIYNFELLEPTIKGEVASEGFVTFRDTCSPLANDSIYLFLLYSMKEEIDGANAVLLSLSREGPGYSWIADWVEGKISSNKVLAD